MDERKGWGELVVLNESSPFLCTLKVISPVHLSPPSLPLSSPFLCPGSPPRTSPATHTELPHPGGDLSDWTCAGQTDGSCFKNDLWILSFLPLCSFTVPCLWCITFSLNSRRFNLTGISDNLHLTLKGSDSVWVLAFMQILQVDWFYKPWFVMDQFKSGSLYEVMKSKYERWAEKVNSSEMDSSLHPLKLQFCQFLMLS